MIQLGSATQAAGTNALTSTNSTLGSAGGSAGSADAFAQELESAIEGIVSQSGNGSQFEIDIHGGPAANGASDYTITVKNLGSAAAPATATSTAPASAPASNAAPQAIVFTPAPASSSVLDELMPTPAGVKPAIYTPPSASAPTPSIDKSQMTPDQAYWAQQPPAVQALQNMDPADRPAAAQKLATQGYQIDVPIMVWGWDPLTTMVERQNYGYTWVPSALESPVATPPGVNYPGATGYDASNPPPGSIKVSTDFAAGTNMQDNYVDPATIEASLSPAAQSQSQSQNGSSTQPSI